MYFLENSKCALENSKCAFLKAACKNIFYLKSENSGVNSIKKMERLSALCHCIRYFDNYFAI